MVLTLVMAVWILFRTSNLGSLSDFGHWGIYYPLFEIAKMPGYLTLPGIQNILILLMIFLPVCAVALRNFLDNKNMKLGLLMVFFTFSLFFSIHRFGYFHLQPALPFFALLTGFVISNPKSKSNIANSFIALSLLVSVLFFTRFIIINWHKQDRFADSKTVYEAARIRENVDIRKSVFFYNLPSQYFVFAGIMPVKPWADNFSWYLEFPGLQETIVKNLENDRINQVVMGKFTVGSKYGLGSYKPAIIDEYINEHYQVHKSINSNILILNRE